MNRCIWRCICDVLSPAVLCLLHHDLHSIHVLACEVRIHKRWIRCSKSANLHHAALAQVVVNAVHLTVGEKLRELRVQVLCRVEVVAKRLFQRNAQCTRPRPVCEEKRWREIGMWREEVERGGQR